MPRTFSGIECDRLMQGLLQVTSDLAAVVDSKGSLVAANDAMLEFLGVKSLSYMGNKIFDYFPQQTGKQLQRIFAEQDWFFSGSSLEFTSNSGEMYILRLQPLMQTESPLERLALFMNRKSDIDLQEQRLRLVTAIEQAAECFIILDKQLKIIYVNQAFEGMTGYSLNEVRGRKIDMLYVSRREKEKFREIVHSITHGEVWMGRTSNTSKQGTRFFCEKTVSPIRGKFGVILGYVSIWRDVTQVEQLEKQLRHAQKMEAIGTLAGGIAHDFNNILGPVILHAEMGADMCNDEQLNDSFKQILHAADRARELINQILHLSRRKESDDPVYFRVSSIVKECLKLLRPSLPANIEITQDLQPESDFIHADPAKLHQVLMNLCTNAAYAIGQEKGNLHIQIKDWPQENQLQGAFFNVKPGRYLLLSVQDTGEGMRSAIQEKIFDPFFTTKKNGKGTGLGLAVVQNLVFQMGGRIKVESSPGKGSVFYVLLPQQEDITETVVEDWGHDLQIRGNKEQILFVDDDESIAKASKMALERLGYRVFSFSCPLEALKIFKSSPKEFDLVITDETMPEIRGSLLAQDILRIRPEMPIILCSGYIEKLEPTAIKKTGVRGFIRKPYHLVELGRTIRAALGNKL